MMNFRAAIAEDAEAIANLHAQSWLDTYRGILSDQYLDYEVWADRKSCWLERLATPQSNQFVLVAIEDGAACGFVCAFGNEYPKWGTLIDNLHVAPSQQGKGIGKALMIKAAEWSLQTFPDQGMCLEVLEGNDAARGFYEAIGARHEETNLWQPPGGGEKVNDMLFIWDSIEGFLSRMK